MAFAAQSRQAHRTVFPAKAGIHTSLEPDGQYWPENPDSRFRGKDGLLRWQYSYSR